MILSKIEKLTYDFALPFVEGAGYEIYDVEYIKEGPHWFLRLFITRNDGVNIDDCEKISRSLSPVLDEKNFISTNYFLEVSSPGIERVLRQDEHFDGAIGEKIKVKLYKEVDGVKETEGELVFAEHSKIVLDIVSGQIEIERKNIAKANVVFDF